MDKIRKLEIKRLIKELNFIESDFIYKNEIINEIDNLFIKSVNLFLEDHPKLKQMFDDKINKSIENIFKSKQLEINNEENYSENETTDLKVIDLKVNNKLKKLYREIAKSTHPDRITNKKLNEIYIKATNCYNILDVPGTYSICDELDITYEIDNDDYNLIVNKISELKERIKFMESTVTWKWHNTEDINKKNKIILGYVKKRLGTT